MGENSVTNLQMTNMNINANINNNNNAINGSP